MLKRDLKVVEDIRVKKLLLSVLLIAATSTAFSLPANNFKLSLFGGGLQTPDENYLNFNNAGHQVGGLGFGLGITHFFDSYALHLDPKWHVGLAGEYNSYADNTYSISGSTFYRYRGYSFAVLGILQYQNEQGFLAYGGLGAAKVVQSIDALSNIKTTSQLAPELTGGLGYAFNKHISLSGFYTYITGEKIDIGANKVAPIGIYGLNLVWTL